MEADRIDHRFDHRARRGSRARCEVDTIDNTAPAAEGDTGAIVVTGSRIARPDYVATSPIVTVTSERFEQTSSVMVEATLDQLPQFQGLVGAADTFPTRGGQSNLNLRGLGSNQSLIRCIS